MKRLYVIEGIVVAGILCAQGILFARPLDSATNYDEQVYLAALDALRHGQRLGSDVFAAQFPGFYDLLRGLSFLSGISVESIRADMLVVTAIGALGAFCVGRRFGGRIGGFAVPALLTIAPPLDLFSYQVIADTPALALSAAALGAATVDGSAFAVGAGVLFAAALSVKVSALTAGPTLFWLLRRRLYAGASGFALVVVALLVAHVHSLGDLWSSGVTYHERARSTPAVIPHPHRQILDQIPPTTPFFVLAALAAAIGIAFLLARRPLRVWPLWMWVVLTVGFLLVHRPLHYNHLVDFPFTLAIATGATIGAALQLSSPRSRSLISAGLVAACLAGFVQQWHRVSLVKAGEPASNVEAARVLDQLTRPSALVADDRPIIAFDAHRRVLGPLVDMAKLRFETGSLTDEQVIRDLPRVDAVVVSRVLRTRKRVLVYLNRNFKKRRVRGGVVIYTR